MKKNLFLLFTCLMLALCVKCAPVQAAPESWGCLIITTPGGQYRHTTVGYLHEATGRIQTTTLPGLRYAPSTNTLTISNPNSSYEINALSMGPDFKIKLSGTNSVYYVDLYNTSVTIQGSGTLTIANGMKITPYDPNLYETSAATHGTGKADLTVKKGAVLTLRTQGTNPLLMVENSYLSAASKAIAAHIPASKIQKTYVQGSGYTYTVTGTSLTVSAATAKTITVKSVKLSKTKLKLEKGKTASLQAIIKPANATNQNVSWKSSNKKVATVKKGKVTAKGKGKATITVTTKDGKKTAKCKVTVTEANTSKASGKTYYGTSTTKSRLNIPDMPEATNVTISGNILTITGSLGKLNSKGVQSGMTSFATRTFTLSSNCEILLSGAGSADTKLSQAQFNAYNQSGLYLWITLTGGKVTRLYYGV